MSISLVSTFPMPEPAEQSAEFKKLFDAVLTITEQQQPGNSTILTIDQYTGLEFVRTETGVKIYGRSPRGNKNWEVVAQPAAVQQ